MQNGEERLAWLDDLRICIETIPAVSPRAPTIGSTPKDSPPVVLFAKTPAALVVPTNQRLPVIRTSGREQPLVHGK